MPTPNNDPANKELSLTFFVDPGNRVYVRNITFSGVTKHQRRGAAAGDAPARRRLALERRARALEAAHRAPAVRQEGGVGDQAGRRVAPTSSTWTYEVEEGPSAQLGGGIGYSESQSFILNGNYADANFMGTGQPHRARSEFRPLQQGVQLLAHRAVPHGRQRRPHRQPEYRDQTQFVSASSDFSSETIGAGLRLSATRSREYQGLRFGLSLPEVEPAHEQRRQRAPGPGLGAQQRQFHDRASTRSTTASAFGNVLKFFGTEYNTAS